jgi:hypothetical protein
VRLLVRYLLREKRLGRYFCWLLFFDEPGELGNYPVSFHLGDKGLKQYFEMVKSFQV